MRRGAMVTLDWGPICTDVAALSGFHQSWKPPQVESLSFEMFESSYRSWGVDLNLTNVLCQGVGAVACWLTAEITLEVPFDLGCRGHVLPNQLDLRTCIPHRCGNDNQGWACNRAESVWYYVFLSVQPVCPSLLSVHMKRLVYCFFLT